MITDFVAEARAYCATASIELGTLGAYAVGDNKLFLRLENGGQCLPRTMDRVRKYMAENPPGARRRRITNTSNPTASRPAPVGQAADLVNGSGEAA